MAHANRENAADADKDEQRYQEHDDTGDACVALLVAGRGVDLFRLGAVRARWILVMHGHVQAPESRRRADRWFAPAAASSAACRRKRSRRTSSPPAQPHIPEFPS